MELESLVPDLHILGAAGGGDGKYMRSTSWGRELLDSKKELTQARDQLMVDAKAFWDDPSRNPQRYRQAHNEFREKFEQVRTKVNEASEAVAAGNLGDGQSEKLARKALSRTLTQFKYAVGRIDEQLENIALQVPVGAVPVQPAKERMPALNEGGPMSSPYLKQDFGSDGGGGRALEQKRLEWGSQPVPGSSRLPDRAPPQRRQLPSPMDYPTLPGGPLPHQTVPYQVQAVGQPQWTAAMHPDARMSTASTSNQGSQRSMPGQAAIPRKRSAAMAFEEPVNPTSFNNPGLQSSMVGHSAVTPKQGDAMKLSSIINPASTSEHQASPSRTPHPPSGARQQQTLQALADLAWNSSYLPTSATQPSAFPQQQTLQPQAAPSAHQSMNVQSHSGSWSQQHSMQPQASSSSTQQQVGPQAQPGVSTQQRVYRAPTPGKTSTPGKGQGWER